MAHGTHACTVAVVHHHPAATPLCKQGMQCPCLLCCHTLLGQPGAGQAVLLLPALMLVACLGVDGQLHPQLSCRNINMQQCHSCQMMRACQCHCSVRVCRYHGNTQSCEIICACALKVTAANSSTRESRGLLGAGPYLANSASSSALGNWPARVSSRSASFCCWSSCCPSACC